ncbi:MAG: hypothetical protein WC310_00135 [Patescibacteria group bacterium]|jgi:hypothetical protein
MGLVVRAVEVMALLSVVGIFGFGLISLGRRLFGSRPKEEKKEEKKSKQKKGHDTVTVLEGVEGLGAVLPDDFDLQVKIAELKTKAAALDQEQRLLELARLEAAIDAQTNLTQEQRRVVEETKFRQELTRRPPHMNNDEEGGIDTAAKKKKIFG